MRRASGRAQRRDPPPFTTPKSHPKAESKKPAARSYKPKVEKYPETKWKAGSREERAGLYGRLSNDEEDHLAAQREAAPAAELSCSFTV